MKKNTNAIKIFSIFFVLILSAVSASALSLVTEFDNGAAEKSIMPGQSTEYYVIGVADQGLSKMHVSGQLYDMTTGEKVLLADLFDMETINTFFYPDAFSIISSDYDNLPGTYLISVKAEEWLTNGIYRAKTSDLKLEVIGNRLPVAEFDYSPSNPTTITPVTFDSSSYDTDGYIVKEEWFSNSAKIGEGNVLTYTFTKPGTYTIMLKVTDNEGGTDTTTKTVVVTQGAQTIYPVADFTYSPLNPKTNEVVTFTSTSYDSDGSIVKEEWDFNNNGAFETLGHVATKTFTQPGSYTVYLKVTDNSNLEASTSKIVVVVDPVPANVPPVADFTYVPVNITADQVVTFTSTSYDVDGSIVKEEWDLNNDGTFESAGHTSSKTFPNEGTYVVSLRVTDDDGAQDVESKAVVVNKFVPVNVVPVANFSYSPKDLSVCGVMVFTSTSYDVDGSIVKEEWDFNNDGVFEVSGHSVSKNFTQSGVYVITLKVTDNSGAVDVEKKTLTINCQTPVNIPPVADFTYVPVNITAGQVVTFTSTSYDVDGSIVKEEWDLNNDGEFTWTGHTVSKNFTQPGTYVVSLRVTDDDGAQDVESKTVVVNKFVPVNVVPVANFSYSPKDLSVCGVMVFTSTSYDVDGSIVKEEWDFNNDGVFEVSGHSVSKNFTQSGVYVITLKVTDNSGAVDVEKKTLTINCQTPVNIPPVANFTYIPKNPLVNQAINFTSNSYDVDGSIVKEEWDLNNDGVFEISGHLVSKAFSKQGNYTVTLRVTDDDGAQDTEKKTIVVVNPVPVNVPPVANFTYIPKNITEGDNVAFTSTSYDPDGYIVAYEWLVDGIYVSSGPTMNISFTVSGIHSVKLTVTDNLGAKDSETKQIFVYCKPNVLPVADFTYNPSNPKAKEQVTFTSTSYDPDGHIVSYEWFVNGKNVSGAQVMQYVFAQPGNYTITLKVKDNDGASASVSKVISISKEDVCPPNAVLRMPESVTMNTLVKMDGSLSTPGCNATITSYKWQVFKKGTLLSELVTTTPYSDYTFTSNAEYKVVLTVYNSNGLSDTDEKTVFAGRPKTGIVVGGEDDLYVDYFDVIGSEYGVIECTQSFAITATVSNDRDEDIEDLRVTFAIPELGYKIKSAAFDLDAGKTKTVTFYGDLDMMKEDIVLGEYYAFIGASDTDTIRVKYFPLIIK